MFGFGFIKRMKKAAVPDIRSTERKKDKRYIVVIAVFAVVILLTLIRALTDESAAEQLRSLKFSIGDGIMLALAAGGYIYLKGRGRK